MATFALPTHAPRAVVAHCPAEIAALDSLYQWLEPHATTQIRARVERLALTYLTKPALERGPLLERLRVSEYAGCRPWPLPAQAPGAPSALNDRQRAPRTCRTQAETRGET